MRQLRIRIMSVREIDIIVSLFDLQWTLLSFRKSLNSDWFQIIYRNNLLCFPVLLHKIMITICYFTKLVALLLSIAICRDRVW